MEGTERNPKLSPTVPRFAPPRTHARAPSRSPTRSRLADDVLADLSPATTLELFTNPSGKMKASIEAASASERAFAIRATVASKKIQEWVDELSGWPWPADGGSVGFEMPSAKRRKLSTPEVGRGQSHSSGSGRSSPEQEYIGSLLSAEFDRYEDRIDEITADMEDLDVEAIKRQVLDTHFSPRSRPSSSGSTAPPTPSLFASSYTHMDDFTAVVTATVLHALPNLSRLMRLMDVWNIRLSVLRKVPPLMLALDDADIALKSGWATIQNANTNSPSEQGKHSEHLSLSRSTFEVMRRVLQSKVTKLGRDLDYMLDTLEGRQDTLPDTWLDRMEALENDYGSWVVAGDRKVREGEWAMMAKARKEEEEARKKKEAEATAIANEKAEQEAEEALQRKAQQHAQKAEAARLKAEQDAREHARQQASKEAAEAEAQEAARNQAEEHAREITKLEDLRRAKATAAAKLFAEEESRAAKAEQEAQEFAGQQAVKVAQEAKPRALLAEEEVRAKNARLQVEQEAREMAPQQGLRDAETAKANADADVKELERQKFSSIGAEAKAAKLQMKRAPQETTRQQEFEIFRDAEGGPLLFQQELGMKPEQRSEDTQLAKSQIMKDFDDAVSLKIRRDAETAELQKKHDSDITRQKGFRLSEGLLISKRRARLGIVDQRQAQPDIAASVSRDPIDMEHASEGDSEIERTKVQQEIQPAESVDDAQPNATQGSELDAIEQSDIDCGICVEVLLSQTPSPSQQSPGAMGAAASSRARRAREFVGSMVTSDLDGAIQPQISQYAPFDGGYEDHQPAIRETKIEIFDKKGAVSPALASPIHIDDLLPQTPTTPATTVSSSAKVASSPESDPSPPIHSSAPHVEAVFPTSTRSKHPEQASPTIPLQTPRLYDVDSSTLNSVPHSLVQVPVFTDGANDDRGPAEGQSETAADDGWIVVDSPSGEFPHSGDFQKQNNDGARPLSRTSEVSGYYTSEPTPEICEAQPAEYFPASPARSPVAQPLLAKPTAAVITPTKSHTSPKKDLAWDDSNNSILSPVAEEKVFVAAELQNLDGPCEPCEIAIRELTPNEDDHSNDVPIFGRELITRIDSPLRQASESPRSSSTQIVFHGAADAQYSISLPLDGRLTWTNDVLSISSVSSDTINVKEECILNTVDYPPTLVATSPGTWKLVPPQTVTSISFGANNASVDSPAGGFPSSRRESISSNTSTVINGRVSESPCSPVISPISETILEYPEDNEQSPSAGRVGHRSTKSYDISPPGSPVGRPIRPSLNVPKRPNFTLSNDTAPSTPLTSTSVDAPFFDGVNVSTTPLVTSPKKANSDEQMQQQISSLLESIPARIRLTSDYETTPLTAQTLRPKRSRRSLTPSYRSSSSMSNYSTSSRAATPSFTLAPAYGKTSSRTRPPSSNPEIKLYHLSRSTGEAPIKLFVRLVGEHGERVMVRVGGGWADLGEYLKEYASHHGRRTGLEAGDKVEIQDLPSRNVSSSSTVTIRNGRSSPAPRPQSVLERDRPGSSLYVRKTRKSIGELSASSSDPVMMTRMSDNRYPSTPLPSTSAINNRSFGTPPSATSSIETDRSSHQSWNDESEIPSLGLAGPTSKKVAISERDQEWVESMKEKVRLASAEKERREFLRAEKAGRVASGSGRESRMDRGSGRDSRMDKGSGRESRMARERTESFGEMDKVGGTKRLFRKSGM